MSFLAAVAMSMASRADSIDEDAALVEIAAYVQARSAFQRHCFRCHTTAGAEASDRAMDRLDMSRYRFVGKRAGTAGRAVRRAIGGAGIEATMPKDNPDSLGADAVASILKWADTFDMVQDTKDKQSGPNAASRARREKAAP